jgi:hypothetical protein
MLVQPQQAATACELDLVQHAIRSWKRAQTLDPNQRRRTAHQPLNPTLDLEHAHVSGRSLRRTMTGEYDIYRARVVIVMSPRHTVGGKRGVVLPHDLRRGRCREPLPVGIDLLQEPVAKRDDLR